MSKTTNKEFIDFKGGTQEISCNDAQRKEDVENMNERLSQQKRLMGKSNIYLVVVLMKE